VPRRGKRSSGGSATRLEAEVLASCYRRRPEVAGERGARSIAFPSIATGAYGFPSDLAARTAVTTLRAAATEVHLVLLADADRAPLRHYKAALRG
jgi:O-acetyl-ADP-ribose deacetylase (regulator of RNase III)